MSTTKLHSTTTTTATTTTTTAWGPTRRSRGLKVPDGRAQYRVPSAGRSPQSGVARFHDAICQSSTIPDHHHHYLLLYPPAQSSCPPSPDPQPDLRPRVLLKSIVESGVLFFPHLVFYLLSFHAFARPRRLFGSFAGETRFHFVPGDVGPASGPSRRQVTSPSAFVRVWEEETGYGSVGGTRGSDIPRERLDSRRVEMFGREKRQEPRLEVASPGVNSPRRALGGLTGTTRSARLNLIFIYIIFDNSIIRVRCETYKMVRKMKKINIYARENNQLRCRSYRLDGQLIFSIPFDRDQAVGCLNDIAPDHPLRDCTVTMISRLVSGLTAAKPGSLNDETGNNMAAVSGPRRTKTGSTNGTRCRIYDFYVIFLVITYGYHSTVRIWCTEVSIKRIALHDGRDRVVEDIGSPTSAIHLFFSSGDCTLDKVRSKQLLMATTKKKKKKKEKET
ncbi:hypothetical protein WN48_07203 [Eufriesea mexicana]|uniref:Uncharacterized protein n=1 Tax=Eufriesea mexicana TaxID=516756 RepID=A0A310SU04_9HYME|nr:hypothetical protein WN48_07203 [Eufriesea mexicana]